MSSAWGSAWGSGFGDAWGPVSASTSKGMAAVNGRKPVRRTISVRSISHAIAGPEPDYPVYRFSGRNFVERPGHNPFKNL